MNTSTGALLSVEIRRNGDQWVVLASYFGVTQKQVRRALSLQRALQIAAALPLEMEVAC